MNLFNGDCLEVLKTFEDNSVDCVFTSPPYNIKRTKGNKYHKYDFDKISLAKR